MDVWMIVDSLPQRGGGMELQAVRLGQTLRSLGVDVHYLSRPGDFSHLPEAERPFIVTLASPPSWTPGPLAAMLYLLQCFALLLRRRKEIEILHAHALSNGLIAALVGWLLGKATLVKVASAGPKGEITRHRAAWLPGLRLRLLRRLDCAVAITPEVCDELAKAGFRVGQIVQIPNGIDTTLYVPIRTRLDEDTQIYSPRVICVARLVEKKRHGLLLEAWRVVADSLPQARLLLVGDGPLRAQVEQRIIRLDLNNSVDLMGAMMPEAVLLLLQQADLFVLPSTSEGLSNAMLEALACAVPVVTTLTAGTATIVQDGITGTLLPEPLEAVALAETIIALLREPTELQKMGNAGRQVVEQHFSLISVAQRYLALYQSLLCYNTFAS